MNKRVLQIVALLLALGLNAEVAGLGVTTSRKREASDLQKPESTLSTTESTLTETEEMRESDPDPVQTDATAETEALPEETTSEQLAQTEPQVQDSFLLTFVGDCTLGSTESARSAAYSFVGTVGTDYDFPFDNVRKYFENDDFTIANLEVVLSDTNTSVGGKTFTFRGDTAYTRILTGSSVEAVTLANNHSMDHGASGYSDTKAALDSAGVTYVEDNGSAIYTTGGGLVIGLYAVSFYRNDRDMANEIASLRRQGADIIIAAVHWGTEGSYRASSTQQSWGHALIDAGVDIVYGCHPHVLQKIESYSGGVIYYSLGNFSFGGNTNPRDRDSVIIQQEVIREPDGSFSLGEMTLIPVAISSSSGRNNYQPVPYEEDSAEYLRALSKLDGTFTGPDLVVDYSFLDGNKDDSGTDSTGEPDTEAPDSGSDTPDAGTDTPDTGTDTPGTGTDTPDTSTDTPGTGTDTPDTGTGGSDAPAPTGDSGGSSGSADPEA